MYKITLSVTNPLSGDSVVKPYLIDESTFDETQWAAGYPLAKDMIESVKAVSASKQPDPWSDAATVLTAKPPV